MSLKVLFQPRKSLFPIAQPDVNTSQVKTVCLSFCVFPLQFFDYCERFTSLVGFRVDISKSSKCGTQTLG